MKLMSYLVMDEATLSDNAREAARRAGGEWVVVNVRNGRQLVSCLAPAATIPDLLAMLTPYHPILVGVWDETGTIIPGYEPDAGKLAAYIDVMPDDIATPVDADTPGVRTRPSVARDVCAWAGWPERVFP